jgi:hypothetical protein
MRKRSATHHIKNSKQVLLFLKKKKQKNFTHKVSRPGEGRSQKPHGVAPPKRAASPPPQTDKSFLLLFFKKEALPSYPRSEPP